MNNLRISVFEYTENNLSVVKFKNPGLFDINKVFDCGQCFRFDKVENSKHKYEYAGAAFDKYISVAQDDDFIYIYNSNEADYMNIWEHYLALDCDYMRINEKILSVSDNHALIDAVRLSSGIRILRQDSWEALCSFIISQNNNIPRIKKIIASLCGACGKPIDVSSMKDHMPDNHKENVGYTYTFPSPAYVEELGIDGLASLRTGFRAKYIFDACSRINRNQTDLGMIKTLKTTAECSDELCKIKGVGPKVAACTLLFGFDRLDAFPVDVWIKKVIAKYFGGEYTDNCLGEYAGVAQQYLFYYERYLNS